MAVNLDALRKKLDQLNGKKDADSGRNDFWKPKLGEHVVRIVPFSDNDGQPFKERKFYYNIGKNPGFLAPCQFGKPDPIQELQAKLYKAGAPSDKDFAKRLWPKERGFVAVIVRGEEDKGVRLWSFGKTIYETLVNKFLDSDYGDLSDPNEGFDIKVKVTQIANKEFLDTKVDVKPKPSKLSTDPAQVKAWISSVPNLDEIYKQKTYDEVKAMVDAWLASGAESEQAVSKQAADIAANATPGETPVPVTAQKGNTKNKTKDLDSAFQELMDDNA